MHFSPIWYSLLDKNDIKIGREIHMRSLLALCFGKNLKKKSKRLNRVNACTSQGGNLPAEI